MLVSASTEGESIQVFFWDTRYIKMDFFFTCAEAPKWFEEE